MAFEQQFPNLLPLDEDFGLAASPAVFYSPTCVLFPAEHETMQIDFPVGFGVIALWLWTDEFELGL